MSDIYDAKTVDIRNTIGALAGRVRNAISAAADEALSRDTTLSAYAVSTAQFAILSAVHSGRCESAGDLCKLMSYDRGAMSRMIDRLETKGLIRRTRRPGERRMIALEITTEGEAALPKMKSCVVGVMNRMLQGVTKSEIKQVEKVLQRILGNGA